MDDADPASFKVVGHSTFSFLQPPHSLLIFQIGESLPGMATCPLSYLSDALSSRLLQDSQLGRHSRCPGNVSAWTSQDIQEQDTMMNPYDMGWHLDCALFDETIQNAVRDVCQSRDGGSTPSSVEREQLVSVEKEENTWRVHCEQLDSHNLKCYHARWVVDVTGRKALLAHKVSRSTLFCNAQILIVI